jgi:hypothetical protein
VNDSLLKSALRSCVVTALFGGNIMRHWFIAGMATAFLAIAAVSTLQTGAQARTARSLDCSKQADAKGLHGKERRSFRSTCLHDTKAKAP